jgi:hypothetical protein
MLVSWEERQERHGPPDCRRVERSFCQPLFTARTEIADYINNLLPDSPAG